MIPNSVTRRPRLIAVGLAITSLLLSSALLAGIALAGQSTVLPVFEGDHTRLG